jgi:hypothetical protein
MVLVINEKTCSQCGHPISRGPCTCRTRTTNRKLPHLGIPAMVYRRVRKRDGKPIETPQTVVNVRPDGGIGLPVMLF